jgi:hypothetical protein
MQTKTPLNDAMDFVLSVQKSYFMLTKPERNVFNRSSVPVTDRGCEEVNVSFSDLRHRGSNQLRDPRAKHARPRAQSGTALIVLSACFCLARRLCRF